MYGVNYNCFVNDCSVKKRKCLSKQWTRTCMGFISFADRMNNSLNLLDNWLVFRASLGKKRVGVLSVRMLSVKPLSAF